MSKDSKTFIRRLWIVACVGFFLLPLLLIPEGDSYHRFHPAIEEMAFGMFILSFPCSLLSVLVIAFALLMFSAHDVPLATYMLLWLGFFVTGYVQWFWLVPGLTRKTEITTLGLAQCEQAKPCKKRRRRNRARRQQLGSSPISHFDGIGRTPLERVIDDR